MMDALSDASMKNSHWQSEFTDHTDVDCYCIDYLRQSAEAMSNF